MRRIIAVVVACLVLATLGLIGFRFISRQTLAREANRTATPLGAVKEKVNTEDLGRYFTGASGSFILFDQKANEYYIYNAAESQKRASPCSTFKILNSLIGLETGVVPNENTPVKWDGTKYDIPEWNRDHTMTTAFGNSVVWYYQKLAAGVGTDRMQQYLDKTHYGNANLSGGLTKFWLDSSLRISPLEQVLFLRQFYAYDLPFSHENIDTVKRIMVMRRENGSTFSGKTGTAGDHLSWFVGYLETGDNVYFFATKVEGKGIPNARARAITESILKEKQLLR